MAKLKVFKANLGFFETIVAAPSQKAALEAWGMRQDLFKEGRAEIAVDPAAIEAALAHPGVVLRRGAGTAGLFTPASDPPTSLPPAPGPPVRKVKDSPASQAPRSKPPPPADRTALTKAEAALADREARMADELAVITQARRRLDEREAELRATAKRERATLQSSIELERSAYVKAGGKA